MSQVLGIDVGGTGVKAAIVDTNKGEFTTERVRIKTPPNANPHQILEICTQLAKKLNFEKGKVGIGFPAVIHQNKCQTATNISDEWINTDLKDLFGSHFGKKIKFINDADAAGYAEIKYGIGQGQKGKVLMLTFGTGIGSGLYQDGVLIPNVELGYLRYSKSKIIEQYSANKIRETQNLDWENWGERVNETLQYIDSVIHPQLIIFGGGVSKHFDSYKKYIKTKTPVVPAKLKNHAGIIGAASWAEDNL